MDTLPRPGNQRGVYYKINQNRGVRAAELGGAWPLF